MTNRIGITVHHQEGVFAPCDHQMRDVIACSSRRLEKISVRFFALKIFHAPRRPKRFQLSFREFVRHPMVRFAAGEAACFPLARLDLRGRKVEPAFTREISSQPRLNVSLTPRGLQILLALCCIALVETTLPIHELKGSTLLSRRNQPPHYATAPGAGKFRVKPT